MNMCRDVVPLEGGASAAGLFEDVGDLAAGRIRLQLRELAQCNDIRRAFYRFDIIEARNGSIVGDITFMPAADTDIVGALGHSGGGLIPEARGTGLYGDALQALAPLARRHGLDEFVIAFPGTNAPAMRGAEKLGLRPLENIRDQQRFVVRTTQPAP